MNNNPPIIHHIEQNEQIQQVISKIAFRFNHRFNEKTNFEEKQIFELKRYLAQDLFASRASYYASANFDWSVHFQVNNKDNLSLGLTSLKANVWTDTILSPEKAKNLKFSKLKTLSLVSNNRINNTEKLRFLSQLAIEFKENLNQYNVDQTGINFKTPKIIRNIATAGGENIDYVNQIFYNNVVLFGQKFVQGKHNTIVYKVAIYNDDQENTERDIALLPKKINGLPLKGNTSLNLSFVKTDTNEIINGLPIVGNIEIADNTYYDFASQQTIQGLANGSKRGYIIPFQFKGELSHIATIDINADFQDVKLIYNQNIDQPYLDPYEGIVKLKMIKNIPSKEKMQFYLIRNKDFGKISQNTLSLRAILSLAKKEEDEFDVK